MSFSLLTVIGASCAVLPLQVLSKFAQRSAQPQFHYVSMVIPSPEVTSSPSAFNHTAVGVLVRPGMTSDITQLRINSDPATAFPELLIVAEIEPGGTAWII